MLTNGNFWVGIFVGVISVYVWNRAQARKASS
jgi:hypothetical protein